MPVESVKLLFTGRGGKDTFEHHRTYSRVYEVITDDPEDDEQVVGNEPGIPVRGDPADFDDQAYVVEVDIQQSDESMLIWYVTVEYDTEPPLVQAVDPDGGSPQPGDVPANPLDEPAKWRLSTQDTEEPAIEGIAVDGAGELVIPDPTQWLTDTVYTRGSYVTNDDNVYVQAESPGVSGTGSGPSGEGTTIEGFDPWGPTTAYVFGDVVENGGKAYRCTTGGTSAGAGGPTGVGEAIADGTVTWEWRGYPARWTFFATYEDSQADPNFAIPTAIVNSAGLPFDPPPLTTVSRAVYSVTINVASATIDYLMRMKNSVNLTEWREVPPRCAKILSMTHDGGNLKNGVAYVALTFEIGFDRQTWDLRILDAGYGHLGYRTNPLNSAVERKFFKFLDANGEPLTEPVPLDGTGQPLEPDASPVFRRYVPLQVQLRDFNEDLPF